MRRLSVALDGIVVLLVSAWAFSAHERAVGRREARIAALSAQIDSLEARKPALVTRYVTDTVTLTRWRTRYDSVRASFTDTLAFHDTVKVREFVNVADSTIHACTAALNDCDRIRLLNDTLTTRLHAAIAAEQHHGPGFKSGLVLGVLTTAGAVWLAGRLH